MASGITQLIITNRALIRLGIPTIDSILDTTNRATVCRTSYDDVNQALQTEYPWRFTIQKKQLSQLVGDPINEWDHRYALPSDMSNGPIAVYATDQAPAFPNKQFEIYGDELYTNLDEVWIDYQVLAPESKFPHYFTSLMVFALAAAIAPTLTDSGSLAQEYHARAFGPPGDNRRGGMFGVAARADSARNPRPAFVANDLVQARLSQGGGATVLR